MIQRYFGLAAMAVVWALCPGMLSHAEVREADTLSLLRVDNPKVRSSSVSYEVEADFSFTGGASVWQGTRLLGNVDALAHRASVVANVPVSENIFLRLGAQHDHYSIGLPENAPLPHTLQSAALVVGADFLLNRHWVLRFELQPGVYSDWEDLSWSRDVNVTGLVGASYIVSPKLQLIGGFFFDPWSDLPVLAGVGVRWEFADQWTLNLVMPKPRLEFKPREEVTLFVGGEWRSGSYRVANDFGRNRGNPKLDGAVVSYREIRAGAGVEWNLLPSVVVSIEGGWMIDREWDFHRADTRMSGDGAGYGQIGLTGRF